MYPGDTMAALSAAVKPPTGSNLTSSFPPAHARIALAFHGEFVRDVTGSGGKSGQRLCSNAFHSLANIFAHIRDPLIAHGASVFTFFATRTCGHAAIDERLRCFLAPEADGYAFVAEPTPKISHSYVHVLSLVERSTTRTSHVVMLRFDVVYSAPIVGPRAFGVDWSKMNYAFRDEARFTPTVKSSDLFWVFPRALLAPLREALRATVNYTVDGHNLGARGGGNGNGHWTYDRMGRAVGFDRLRFIDPRRSSSNIEPSERFFLGIDRSCPPPHEELIAAAAAGALGCAQGVAADTRRTETVVKG